VDHGATGSLIPITSPLATLGEFDWVAPGERDPQSPARRVEVYEGTGIGHVDELLPDPEGRFVLAVERQTGSVFQVSTDGSGALQKLYDGKVDPRGELGSAPHCEVRQDGLLERLYIIGAELGPNEGYGLVFADSNNDGVFDLLFWLEPASIEALAPPSSLEELLVYYDSLSSRTQGASAFPRKTATPTSAASASARSRPPSRAWLNFARLPRLTARRSRASISTQTRCPRNRGRVTVWPKAPTSFRWI